MKANGSTTHKSSWSLAVTAIMVMAFMLATSLTAFAGPDDNGTGPDRNDNVTTDKEMGGCNDGNEGAAKKCEPIVTTPPVTDGGTQTGTNPVVTDGGTQTGTN